MNFERKFVASAEGVVEQELTDAEKEALNKLSKSGKKIATMSENREFSVGPDGTTQLVGSNEDKLKFKNKI